MQHRRLESWKEIAKYLGRDVRTVQRWETKEGLPVRRTVHEKGANVYADTEELDAWWQARQQSPQAAPMPLSSPPQAPEIPPDLGDAGRSLVPGALAFGGIVILAVAASLVALRRGAAMPTVRAMPIPIARVLAESTREGAKPAGFPVPEYPTVLTLSPDGTMLYVAGLNWLARFDPGAGRMLGRTSLDGLPAAMAISPDGARLYVGENSGVIWTVDTQAFTVRKSEVNGALRDVALTPDGAVLYIAALQQGLKKMNTATGRVSSVAATACPAHLAVTPDGQRLIIAYECGGPRGRSGHDSIEIYGLPSETPVKTISGLPNVGGWMSVSPDGSQLWEDANDACSNPAYDHLGCREVPSRVIHVFRLSDFLPIQSISVPSAAGGAAFLPDGSRVLLAGNSDMEVINSTNFQVEESLAHPVENNIAESKPLVDAAHLRAFRLRSNPPQVVVYGLSRATRGDLPGLAARWPADGTPADVRLRDNAVLHDGVTYAPGVAGQAWRFDGHRGFVDIPPMESYAGIDGGFGADFWVKPDPSAKSPAMILDDGPALQIMLEPSGTMEVCWEALTQKRCGSGDAAILSVAPVSAGRWHHVAVSREGDTLGLYLDGALAAQHKGVTLPLNVGGMRLGARAGKSDFLSGSIDELEWYARTLTSEDVAALHRAANAQSTVNLTARGSPGN